MNGYEKKDTQISLKMRESIVRSARLDAARHNRSLNDHVNILAEELFAVQAEKRSSSEYVDDAVDHIIGALQALSRVRLAMAWDGYERRSERRAS